jgi:prefoldin subunit 5
MASINDRIKNLETENKKLKTRVSELEEQMLLCLKFMRKHAEDMAQKKDPNFKKLENHEA